MRSNRVKAIFLAVVMAAYPAAFAHAGVCTPAMEAKIVTNLEWMLTNDAAKRCVWVKILSHDRNAYQAFYDCIDALRTGGFPDKPINDYEDCRQQACAWALSHSLTPTGC